MRAWAAEGVGSAEGPCVLIPLSPGLAVWGLPLEPTAGGHPGAGQRSDAHWHWYLQVAPVLAVGAADPVALSG